MREYLPPCPCLPVREQGVSSEGQLRTAMEAWGPTGNVTLARQPDNNRPKGFGFVEFKRSHHAEA